MKSRRRTVLVAAAAVIVLGGVAVGTGETVAANAETARLCDVARGKLVKASATVKKATAAANAAVKSSEGTALPNTDGWTSNEYADKPASTAQPTGSSGKDRLAAVAAQQKKLQALATSPMCKSRDDAEAVTARATSMKRAVKQLSVATSNLTDDFRTFQADETTRITAEKAAAKAAEEAAAEQAAEAEAARQAAAAEAAQQAAVRAAAAPKTSTGPSSVPFHPTTGSPATGGPASEQGDRATSPWGSTAPRKAPDSVGGGSVGSGSGGGCWTDNGMGGTKAC